MYPDGEPPEEDEDEEEDEEVTKADLPALVSGSF